MQIRSSTYTGFVQLAYVTNDFDRALTVFGERHGVMRFLELREFTLQTGADQFAEVNIAIAMVDGMEIEIIQPLDGADKVYRCALAGKDFQVRFHHIGERVESLECFEHLKREVTAASRRIDLWGSSVNGAHYFYVDDRDTLGHHVEYIYRAPDDLAAFLARVPTAVSVVG